MRTGLFCGLATIVVAASATPAQAEQQTYNFELRTQDKLEPEGEAAE